MCCYKKAQTPHWFLGVGGLALRTREKKGNQGVTRGIIGRKPKTTENLNDKVRSLNPKRATTGGVP